MTQFPILMLVMGALALITPSIALAQRPTPPTASLSGHLLSEEGRALHATITLSFAAPRGYPVPPRRVSTNATGAFAFSRLPAGSYTLCAQVDPAETAPANSPYVDTCVWGATQAPIDIAAGQQIAGAVLTAAKGAWLDVHVADPEHVLPQTLPAKGPALLEPELQLILKSPNGLFHNANFVSSDNGGRHYRVAVPLKTALGLRVSSKIADAFDDHGNKVQETDEVGVQPNTPGDLQPVHFTLHAKH